jgi:hypothetical protein
MPAFTEKYVLGPLAMLMGAELNALAPSATFAAGAVSTAVYNNNQGSPAGFGDGFTMGAIELFVSGFAAAPAAGSAAYVFFLVSLFDQEDGAAAVVPARAPDVVIPFRAAAGNQRIALRDVWAPIGSFRTLLTHNATAFAATGNTLRWLPYTRQGVG